MKRAADAAEKNSRLFEEYLSDQVFCSRCGTPLNGQDQPTLGEHLGPCLKREERLRIASQVAAAVDGNPLGRAEFGLAVADCLVDLVDGNGERSRAVRTRATPTGAE
jgi:hypothetical protein